MWRHFERTEFADDLEAAIEIHEQAVESTPDHDPARAERLSDLANALQTGFDRTTSTDYLNRAITTNEEAIKLVRQDHPIRRKLLNHLGIALQKRSEHTGSMEDLDRALVTKRAGRFIDPGQSSKVRSNAIQFGDRLIEAIRKNLNF